MRGGNTFELLKKFNRPGPRYTSYPTAVEFHEGYGHDEYCKSLALINRCSDEPLSLYIHLPFCEERCSFCGCNVVITKKREVSHKYLDYLHREIDMLAEALPNRRRISQYHWGGGTPTYQTPGEMAALHKKITEHFTIDEDAEVAIEVDPRVTSFEQVDLLRELGFNRISMGVQDFTPEVQEAINRNQTEKETVELYDYCRKIGFKSINVDLIYGLPLQTVEAFSKNMDTLLKLRPDRVAVYSYAYIPWVKANQKKIDTSQLPTTEVKLELFSLTRDRFLAAGYDPIGMDHFALPDDELALAAGKHRLHRNFMGYTVKMGSDMVGVGTSAIGDVGGAFAQNVKKLSTYYQALDDRRFPVEKGYILSRDDLIRREVIARLMSNMRCSIPEIEALFDIDFREYFQAELDELAGKDGPVQHGFLTIAADHLDVPGEGRLFIRNICMIFDAYMKSKRDDQPMFSQTV
jgi:oxygen-independent coproporphyrinogen-3 oxidase